MKKTFFTTILLALTFLQSTSLWAEENPLCKEMIISHMKEIDSSEAFIAQLDAKTTDITSFDITQLQKDLTTRFVSLKALMVVYEDNKMNCSPKILGEAIAVYDLSKLGKSIFAKNDLRRIVLGFSKYSRYRLTDLVSYYKKYTQGETIMKIQDKIIQEGIELPAGVILDPTHPDFDPNLYKLSDAAIKGTTSVVAGLARIWGFVSDQLKWRQGFLNKNTEALEKLNANLKPLDLVFETRAFTLSNYTIPGHWGHVGVWLGKKEELIALGVWDKEFFRPFRQFVEAGQNIVEIRKEGLNFQSIESFLNLDEIAVTRIEGIHERAVKVFEELSEQIDKKYDFKFDARTADKITCAELIAFSYGDIKWPQTKTLFQISLRPDDLAVLTLDETSTAKFVLYLKGTKNNETLDQDFSSWSKLFKVKKHINAEEEALEKERLRAEREERRRWEEMYRG